MSRIKSSKLILLVVILTMAICNSCVEEYWPELDDNNDNLLVIEGKITNEAGPYTIQLSNPSSIHDPILQPLSNASVLIIENEGIVELLTEVSPGVYMSSENGIQGLVGREYKLRVETNGKVYESEFEELLPSIGIESITYQEDIDYAQDDETDGEDDKKGFQYYVSTEIAPSSTNYYYWEIDETYEYHSPYKIESSYSGQAIVKKQNKFEFYYCWTTKPINNVYTQSTINLSEAKINNLPLHFVSFDDEKLKIRYSILVKQYSISKNAQIFYSGLEEQNSDQGSLYSKQPYQIRGNMRNLDDPDEIVLGYFLTGGVATKRIFTPAVYQMSSKEWSMKNCNILSDGGSPDNSLYGTLLSSGPNDWPMYMTYAWVMVPDSHPVAWEYTLAVVSTPCVDCREHGGTIQKPDFWDQ